jgi:hypothetical protein
MSKKHKKSRHSVVKSLSPQSLAQSAASLYSAGDYKNALPRYERLYKEQPDKSTKELLISCFLERTKQLHQKQMYLEACALFANLQLLAPESLPIYDYLNCLIKARYYEKAFALCSANALDENSIPSEVATWLVVASTVYQKASMSTELFHKERVLAQDVFTLLDADANSASLMLKLKTISLRSPLKDLRLLIQSLLLFQTNQTGSLKLAKEIKETSPFFAIAYVIVLACKSPIELFMELANLSTLQLRLLAQLKGWSDKQLDTLIIVVTTLAKQLDNVKKIRFFMQLPDVPQDLLKQICLSLYDGKAVTWKLIADRFGNEAFVRAKINAILAEKQSNPKECIKLWNECISTIKQDKTLSPELIGLIKLHQYELLTMHYGSEHTEGVDWLIESLDYLPSRKATYIKLCNIYAQEGNKKLYQKWLDNMHKQFPDDIEVLLKVATHSKLNKTYTNTINILKKALEVDSINTRAKQLLAHTYFEKALDEISKKKAKNATIAIKNAQSLQQYMCPSCLVPIGESFLAFCKDEIPMMKEHLHLAYQKAGNRFFVNYVIMYYNTLLKLNALGLVKSLIWDTANETPFIELIQGLKGIRDYLKNHGQKKLPNFEGDSDLRRQINATLKMISNHGEFELLCILFLELRWYASLVLTANSALKIHKKSALFYYFLVEGEIKGDISVLTNRHYITLSNIYRELKQLPDNGQSRTVRLIENLLDEYLDFFGNTPENISDVLDEFFV